MKKTLCFVLLLIISTGLKAQQIEKGIVVSGLKETYKKGEPLVFNVLNNYKHDVNMSVGLQSYMEEVDEWFDQVQDLDVYNCNPIEKYGIEYFLIKPQGLFVVNWSPKKANKKRCFNWKVFDGKFRIVVRVRREIYSVKEEFFSSTFTIQ